MSSPTTLIVGENGSGKSTMIDALCFGLFGKPFRKASIPTIVNSVNKKDMIVEVDFDIGRKEYKIRRGINPRVFEVYQNGKMINQSSSVKDYQKFIEHNILKLNFRSFTQIVVLGSSSFVPFMELTAAHRREVIEDLLDIRVFSIMNSALKEKVSENKENLKDNDGLNVIANERHNLQTKYIDNIQRDKAAQIEANQQKTCKATKAINKLTDLIDELTQKCVELDTKISDEGKYAHAFRTVRDRISKFQSDQNILEKSLAFFEKNDDCPTCNQEMSEDFRQGKINNSLSDLAFVKNYIEDHTAKKDILYKKLMAIKIIQDNIGKIHTTIGEHNSKIGGLNTYINKINEEIKDLTIDQSSTDKEISKRDNLKADLTSLVEDKKELVEHRELLDVASILLKDGGIKSQIINQYIPIINKLINKYLASMDFFISFELDNSFNECIKSRYRDEFSYSNFSEGEKTRINLSLLYTWRSIARLKNSINTNLLIFDEILDSSLDEEGIEHFKKIIEMEKMKTNVFVISHRTSMEGHFEKVLKFEKFKNFSIMKEKK